MGDRQGIGNAEQTGDCMKDENILYWIWLSERCGVASKDAGRLAERYSDPFDIYRMDEEETERIEGISPSCKLKLLDKYLESSYATLKYCKQKKIDIISYSDKRYPSRLRNIEDPPMLLYVLGELPPMNDRLCIGMVGTRKMSEYGMDSAYKISYELSAAGCTVVSGMALGVDGVAACGALAAGGKTVAVLGCGISVIYPKEHARLMSEIAKRGAVVTEYPPFEKPHGYNFPKRNRIISGLCQGVLVVEGSASSGALITARRAVDQGRELFALPGKISESNSEGPNELIKSGALVALSADDIIAHYDFLYRDCIDYRSLRDAKSGGMSVDRALKKYGVGGIYKRAEAYRPAEAEETAAVTAPAAKPEKVHAKRAQRAEMPAKPQTETAVPDNSARMLETLDETSKKVFFAMPEDRAISPDGLSLDGVGIGEIITALTMLEISGLVASLPGGMYIRK